MLGICLGIIAFVIIIVVCCYLYQKARDKADEEVEYQNPR